MAAAVQWVYDSKFGPAGTLVNQRPKPFKDPASFEATVPRTPDWCVDAAKKLCTYIWDTYGKFPAAIPPMQMNVWFQAHHLETEFYDRHYQPGAYHDRVRDHMRNFHPQLGELPRRRST
jgi:hypothetical protein